MVLTLQFAPSTSVHLEITCKYIWPCFSFCWDQTQFYYSYIPDWLLVEYNWCKKGWSLFTGKVYCFHHYLVSLQVIHLICWIFHVLTCLWVAYQHSCLLWYLYHYIYDRSCVTWTMWVWDHFALPYCGLGPKLLSYMSSFLFLDLCFFLLYIYMLNDSVGITLCVFGLNYTTDYSFTYVMEHLL